MLDSLRKKTDQRTAYNPPLSPYGKMQEALSPAQPAQNEPLREAARSEVRPDVRTDMRTEAGDAVKPATENAASASRLIVGPDIKLKGAEITDCDTLVVEGRVEASLDSRALQISEKGVFVGTCGVDMAEIRGSFEGELTVRKQLVVRASGRISGKIRYGKMAIEEGGELSGDIAAIGDKNATDLWKSSNGAMPKPAAGR